MSEDTPPAPPNPTATDSPIVWTPPDQPAASDNPENKSASNTGSNSKKKKKRRRKKKKKGNGTEDTEEAAPGAEVEAEAAIDTNAGDPKNPTSSSVDDNQNQQKLVDMTTDKLKEVLLGRGKVSTSAAHKFWDTQPVPREKDEIADDVCGPVDPLKTPDDVPAEPYPLPRGFHWSDMDVTDEKQLQEIYDLLTRNYVEDDDAMFRFDYSPKFLMWALTPPGYHPQWHVGVRQTSNNRLRGFITGVPAKVRIKKKFTQKMAEINFLCVHKKLRAKRLTPVLIKEVTRRVNRLDQWQAVYTAGIVLPKPVSKCRYWHRSLNPKKLIDIGFSRIGPRMTMNRTIRLYKLPDAPKIPGIQPMLLKHVPSAHKLLNTYLKKFDLNIEFDEEEIAHWLLPRERVIDSFVVLDKAGNVTDLCSFYHLPSSIINHEKYKKLNATYSFYNVATTVTLHELMHDCLTMAKLRGCDVFNALDIMENGTFLKDLKFGIGDGNLQYYLFNWQCSHIEPKDIGIVLM